MPSNLINSANYASKLAEEIEFEKIFSKNWIFAGIDSDLEQNNAFITLEIFNYPIVLQNFKGEIKAFENICPHRFNKIQTEKCGERPFVCKYHNWAFDSNGQPLSAALRNSFDIATEEFKCLKVRQLRIEKAGKFIFVSLDANIRPLKDYLGIFYEKLLEISGAITNRFYFEDDYQKVNWKIVVENVIEAYHCPAIHRKTLYGMGFCSIPEENNEYFEGHSVADYPKREDVIPEKILKYLDKRKFKHESFRHYYIFPNLLISSTEATSIYVGNVLPISSNETVLRKRFFDVAFEEGFVPKPAVHKGFLSLVEASINAILEEDKEVLEQLQKNMTFANNTYYLGKEEQRIAKFHEHYNKIIDL